MSYSGGWRPHIESALCLDLRRMFQEGALRAGGSRAGSWHWTCNGEETASIGYRAALDLEDGTLMLSYTTGRDDERESVTCTIRLVTLPRHYGGHIWYFVCPYTGRARANSTNGRGSPTFATARRYVQGRPTLPSGSVAWIASWTSAGRSAANSATT